MRSLIDLQQEYSGMLAPTFRGFECGEGWSAVLDRALGDLRRSAPQVRLSVAKEKLGTLRLIMDDKLDANASAIARRAEEASAQTCEMCGEPGRLISTDCPVRTRCATHEADR
ncbi:hypothetical protein IT570_01910 [Candidatus Sumerlaeota bacterium]|nr:hypothetical protein [Candidatus Sumerlaeota bacterium]